MSGQTTSIKTSDGKEFTGYLVRPKTPNGAGVVVIQEIFGVNEHIRDVADLYAEAGFTALAPDIFWRVHPDLQIGYSDADMKKGFEIAQKLDSERAILDLVDTAQALRNISGIKSGIQKVGAVGYCRGGQFAYRLACKNAVDAAVSYYGGGIEPYIDEARGLRTPLLMHFAGKDDHISMSTVEKIQKAISHAAGQVYVYEGVHHGFNCDQRGSYNRKAAMIAFAQSIEFFNKYLLVSKPQPVSVGSNHA